MLQYLSSLSPNTPVEVCTIVGKYDWFIDVRWYRPSPGQTLRIVNSKTNYLNLLRTCKRDSSHAPMRRLLVDLDAEAPSSGRGPQIYQLAPEKCLIQPFIKACGLTSSSIYFIEDSIEKLADNYLAWAETCSSIVEEPIKSTAYIVLCGSQLDGQEEFARQFLSYCTSTAGNAARHVLSHRCFSHTGTFYLSRLTNQKPRSRVNWPLLDMVQQQAPETANNRLASLGYCWREKSVHQLFSSSLAFFSNEADGRVFSMAQALSVDVPGARIDGRHQRAFFDFQLQKSPRFCDLAETTTSLLGLYVAYHVLAYCPLLFRENFKLSPASCNSLFDFLFHHRYKQIVEYILECIMLEQPTAIDGVKSHACAAIDQYLSTGACITQTHLSGLQKFHRFFQQQPLQRLCAGCYFAYWDDVLPCHHGFCKNCTHNYSTQWKTSARIQFNHCPICAESFSKPFIVRLQPPTAGGRILSLDGGGVKGIVELEILEQLSNIIGGKLSIDKIFDMAVGTSIGGIIALGISVSQWDIDLCKEKFVPLTSQIFLPRNSGAGWFKGTFRNALRYAKYAAYLALQRSLVSGKLIQSLFCREFGDQRRMMFPAQTNEAPIRAAVTTCNTRDSACSIITSYNRPLPAEPRSYKWLQERDNHLHVRVWEAARCTSAVPFLFPAAVLQDERYYDGALVYNNPTVLAIEEAKLFWDATDVHNTVLSVGCGITRDQYNERDGPLSCCTHSFLEGMSAAKQNSELLLRGYHFMRLDPFLDMEVTSLDDYAAIPQLQQSVSNALLHDVKFSELLHATAFQLLSSFFYFEVLALPVFISKSKEYCITGVVRPRIPSRHLQHLHSHHKFGKLHFRIQKKTMSFSMPKKVHIRVRDPTKPIEIELANNTRRVKISGLPRSVTELLQLQESFYRRHGSQKRRLPRHGST